jgi:hypothetical protein
VGNHDLAICPSKSYKRRNTTRFPREAQSSYPTPPRNKSGTGSLTLTPELDVALLPDIPTSGKMLAIP